MSLCKATATLIFAVLFATTVLAGAAIVDYPSGYRSWQHVKSAIIQPGHPVADPFEGIHHIYANDKAMRGLTDGDYEDGAVFVFDLLAYEEKDNAIVERARKRVDVMQRDANRFVDTDGWGYDSFVGDSSTEQFDQDVVTACYACHIPAKDSGFVYSSYRK